MAGTGEGRREPLPSPWGYRTPTKQGAFRPRSPRGATPPSPFVPGVKSRGKQGRPRAAGRGGAGGVFPVPPLHPGSDPGPRPRGRAHTPPSTPQPLHLSAATPLPPSRGQPAVTAVVTVWSPNAIVFKTFSLSKIPFETRVKAPHPPLHLCAKLRAAAFPGSSEPRLRIFALVSGESAAERP